MTTKTKLLLVLFATVALPLSWANAAANASFTNGAVINSSPGATIVLNLQLAFTVGTETSTAVDYFLKQTAGPLTGQFTITSPAPNRNYTGSDFPDPSATDAFIAGQNLNAAAQGNTTDLGSTKADTTINFVGGTHFIAGLSLLINSSAPAGTYTIQTTFGSYGANGSNGGGTHDTINWDQQASINIVLVPEPATWSLLGLGGLGTLGLTLLRARRHRI